MTHAILNQEILIYNFRLFINNFSEGVFSKIRINMHDVSQDSRGQELSGFGSREKESMFKKSGKLVNVQKVRKIEHEVRILPLSLANVKNIINFFPSKILVVWHVFIIIFFIKCLYDF